MLGGETFEEKSHKGVTCCSTIKRKLACFIAHVDVTFGNKENL